MNALTIPYPKNDRLRFRLCLILINILVITTLYVIQGKRDLGLLNIEENALSAALGLFAQILTLTYYFSWGKITGNYLNLFGMFLVSFVLFCLGQVIIYSYGVRTFAGANMFTRLPVQLINSSAIYTLICLAAFFSGALLVIDSPKKPVAIEEEECNLAAFRKVGKLLLVFSAIPFLYSRTTTLLAARSIGYEALYNYSNYGSSRVFKIIEGLSSLFTVGLIMLLVGYKHDKNKRNLITLFLSISAVITLMMGERTGAASMLLVVYWYRSFCLPTKKDKKKNLLGIILVSVLLLLAFPAIQRLRHEGIANVVQISQIVARNGIVESLISSIASVGFSVFPLAKTMEIVPLYENYRYGITYLMALTTVFPNLFFEIHPAQKYSALASWLMKSLNMTYGPGYSMPAEAYINFGWFPLPIMLLAGYLIARLLYITKDNRNDPFRVFVAMMFFFMNITLPRREFLGVVRDIAYYIIPAYLVLKGISRKQCQQAQGKKRGV